MKLNLKKLLSSLLCLAMILGSLSSGIYTTFVHAEKAPEYTIFAHGGSISYTYIADKFSGTAVKGSVLTITFNEAEYEGKTFDCWKADTGETIPQKSFELLVDQDIYFFPVFKQTDANFSPWTLFDERNCAEGDIYVREDIENALREYKRVYKNNGYHEYGNYKCLNETDHYTVCSICGDENIEPHSWDYGEITVKPTHDIEGIKVYTCTFCGATKTEIISNEDAHDMSDWIVVEEAKNGNVGIRKKVCDCGYTEQSYYVEAEWERFYQDHYIEFDTKSFVMINTTDRDERHYSYINSDGNKSYIYAIKMDDRDAEQTYALMFVDDPLLAVKPIYMAKSDSNNGYKGFDWSIYAYAHDFYGYMEIVNGMDHSKRASSFTFNGQEWADYYNSYNFKEKDQLPSGCYYERDLEYLGMECRQYAIYNDSDKTDLYKVYYVTKDSNVTVFIENYKARTNRSVTEYKPIASDEEYDAMDQDTQKKYLKKSDISKSVRELNKNDSRRDLVINEDRPEKSQYYSMNVSSHDKPGYSYDYNYYGINNLSYYYYGIIFGYPDNPFEVGIDDLYKVNFIAEDRPGYEFDYWEIYDWETQTWDFFSDDIDYACNYVKLNSNRTQYIEDTRIKDATKVRAVYREAPSCHVRVEGGFFSENYNVTNVSEGDVLKGINIYIVPDRNKIPEGKELDYWEASINGGEAIRIDWDSITVTGDMVLTPVYKDIICYVNVSGEGGVVTDISGECFMGATVTTNTTAYEGYTTFLGWYKLTYGIDRIEYELITTNTTLSYVVDEYFVQLVARWSDGTIDEEPHCDITIVNGFASRGYKGIFVSTLRLRDYSGVTMVKDPYQTGMVSKWTVTGQFDDGIDYYEEIDDIFEGESEFFIFSCADLPEKITITAVMAQCTEHDWDEGVITKPASHIEEGIITYTCLFCGEKRIEVIPKTSEHTYGRWQKHNAEQHMRVCECGDIEYADHNWDNGVITTAATHTTAGVRTFTCSECGETKTEDIEPTSEHIYGRWQKHNAEQHMRVCECGDIEYADHNWDNGVITTAATHTTAGVRTFTCSECGETKTEDIEPTSEHTYGRWQKHNAEQHMRVCECGDIEYADHNWDNGVITTAATHTTAGVRTFTCSECGETKTEDIEPTSEHTYGRWQKHNAEQHMRVCECGDIEYADHNWDNGVITTAATHTTAGVRTFTCSECGETKTEDIEPTSEHIYGRWQKHNAEQHMRVCECGDIEYADHNWDNGVITTAATHTTAGVRTFTCSECGETKTEDIEPTSEHTYGRWQKHNAEQHMRVCECGDIEYADHNWDNGVITTAATHTTAGVRTFTCSECGETKTEDIEPTSEHSYGRWQKHNDEQHMRVCECGDIEYADHDWDNGKPSEDGSGIVFTCTVCEAIKTVACENHQFSDWQQSDTEHYRTCSLCGKIERGVHDYTGSTDNSCIICGFKEQGKIYHDIDNQNNALNAELQVNESTDLDALILNDDDRERVGSGEDVRISLEVSDATETVSADEKAKIQSVLGNNFVGLYLDINLYKQIGTDEKQKVAETNGKVCITIKIPDELISKTTVDYIYKIVRVHEGKAEILEGIFNPETKTFVFETDQFSLYALIYSEAESETDTSGDISNNTDPEGSPQTGDGRNIALTLFLTLFAFGSLAIANMNRRKRKRNQ